jgi:hypothetical protein
VSVRSISEPRQKGPADVEAQLQWTQSEERRLEAWPPAFCGELDASPQDGQAARLLDEIRRAGGERRLLQGLVGKPGQKNHRCRDGASTQFTKHLETVRVAHAPIQQDHVRGLISRGHLKRGEAAGALDDVETFIRQVHAERATVILVIIDDDDPA